MIKIVCKTCGNILEITDDYCYKNQQKIDKGIYCGECFCSNYGYMSSTPKMTKIEKGNN